MLLNRIQYTIIMVVLILGGAFLNMVNNAIKYDAMVGHVQGTEIASLVTTCLGLIMLIGLFWATIARLHDRCKSGWNSLWLLVPIVSFFYVVYNCIKKD